MKNHCKRLQVKTDFKKQQKRNKGIEEILQKKQTQGKATIINKKENKKQEHKENKHYTRTRKKYHFSV